jgi:hypothetical protein
MRPLVIGVFVAAFTVMPLVGSGTVGAVSSPNAASSSHVLTAHVARVCGPVTFEWNTDDTVTYFQIHATGVSCAVAKNVIIKGGKYDGEPPAGWTYLGTASRGSDCDSTYKHGAARVTGYMLNNGQGC